MSTSDTVPYGAGGPGTEGARAHEETAPHFHQAIARRRPLFAPYLAAGAMHHLVQCTDGVWDFTADTFGTVLAGDPGIDISAFRESSRHCGQQLSLAAAGLNRQLAGLRTGTLIRMVLQAGFGSLYCNTVVPGTYIVGTALTRPRVMARDFAFTSSPDDDSADRAMSDLASRFRRLIRLTTLNPGGFDDPGDTSDRRRPVEVHCEGPSGTRLAEICRNALSPDDVHYLAHYRQGGFLSSSDILSDPDLADLFNGIAVDSRRELYRAFGDEACTLLGELGRIVSPVIGAPVFRLVLDVEQGAIYIMRVTRRDYLLGVTLDQRRVGRTDAEIVRVAAACGRLARQAGNRTDIRPQTVTGRGSPVPPDSVESAVGE